jgi:hypothetical protein
MDAPEYILCDEIEACVTAVKTALGLSVLNFQYGYVKELNETLKQMENDPAKYAEKFPLVWLSEEPASNTIARGDLRYFGTARPDILIIMSTDKNFKAKQRMDTNYKPVLLPIYRELLNQIVKSSAFEIMKVDDITHTLTKGYYWGENQQTILNDAVDCLKMGSVELPIAHKSNCSIISNF